MTSKEALQDLFTISNKITKDKLNLDTKEIFERYKVIREDLAVLDILKSKFSKTEYGNYWIDEIFSKENYPGYEKHNEEFELIKEWLEEK